MTISSPRKALDKPHSEVIFSTNEMIIAQCYKEAITDTTYKQSILQGSVVKVVSSYDNSYSAFGIVAKINNSSLDNIHKPSALGLSFKELEQLAPQVYDLLRKELEIYLFAHKEQEGQIFNYPPPRPMMIHDFVYKAQEEELLELTYDLSSLISLIKKNQLKIDLLVDLINHGYRLRNYNDNYLLEAGKKLTLAFSDEVDSLMQVLKRLSESNRIPKNIQ